MKINRRAFINKCPGELLWGFRDVHKFISNYQKQLNMIPEEENAVVS